MKCWLQIFLYWKINKNTFPCQWQVICQHNRPRIRFSKLFFMLFERKNNLANKKWEMWDSHQVGAMRRFPNRVVIASKCMCRSWSKRWIEKERIYWMLITRIWSAKSWGQILAIFQPDHAMICCNFSLTYIRAVWKTIESNFIVYIFFADYHICKISQKKNVL